MDDGSTDATLSQMRAWERRDARVRALHQENGGVSRARNAGVEAAQGEWVSFLDCDDKLEEDALADLLARTNDAVDMVLGSYTVVYEDGRMQRFDPAPGGKKEAIDSLLRGDSALPSMCARLYRRSFLVDADVKAPPDVRIGEDVLFNLEAFYAARAWNVVPRSVYTYLLRGDGAMGSIRGSHYAAQADMLAGERLFPGPPWAGNGALSRASGRLSASASPRPRPGTGRAVVRARGVARRLRGVSPAALPARIRSIISQRAICRR